MVIVNDLLCCFVKIIINFFYYMNSFKNQDLYDVWTIISETIVRRRLLLMILDKLDDWYVLYWQENELFFTYIWQFECTHIIVLINFPEYKVKC